MRVYSRLILLFYLKNHIKWLKIKNHLSFRLSTTVIFLSLYHIINFFNIMRNNSITMRARYLLVTIQLSNGRNFLLNCSTLLLSWYVEPVRWVVTDTLWYREVRHVGWEEVTGNSVCAWDEGAGDRRRAAQRPRVAAQHLPEDDRAAEAAAAGAAGAASGVSSGVRTVTVSTSSTV